MQHMQSPTSMVRVPCNNSRLAAQNESDVWQAGMAVDVWQDGSWWSTATLACGTTNWCDYWILLDSATLQFWPKHSNEVRLSYLYHTAGEPHWTPRPPDGLSKPILARLQPGVRDTTGVTFPCLYKGVYPASPVYEPTRAPTLWIASMVLQCQGTAETIVIGHYPQQAVAAWMADEGMRLLHEVLSKECDGALLNFDPRTLEQVLQRLGLTADDLPAVQLPEGALKRLQSLHTMTDDIELLWQPSYQAQEPARKKARHAWEQDPAQLSNDPVAPRSPTPSVQPCHRDSHTCNDNGHVGSYLEQPQALHKHMAAQDGQVAAEKDLHGVTSQMNVCYGKQPTFQWQHGLGGCCLPHQHVQLQYGQHHANCGAVSWRQDSGNQFMQCPPGPDCTCDAHWYTYPCSCQQSDTGTMQPQLLSNSPYCSSGPPPQTAGLTCLQPGSVVNMRCKDMSGSYCYDRRLLVDSHLGDGGHAEVWKVREFLAPQQLQLTRDLAVCHTHTAPNLGLQLQDRCDYKGVRPGPAAAVDTPLLDEDVAAGDKSATRDPLKGNEALGHLPADLAELHHHDDSLLSQQCMALKLALRYDKATTPPKQRPKRYYQLQQQAMSGEFNTMYAARQQGRLQHIVEGYEFGEVAYADKVVVPCILMEYAEAGNLKDQVSERSRPPSSTGKPTTVFRGLSAQGTWSIVGQIAAGLADLHNMGVIHRDVKCSNCVGVVQESAAPPSRPQTDAFCKPPQAPAHAPSSSDGGVNTLSTSSNRANGDRKLSQVQWKLCDFGTSRYVTGLTDLVREKVGTKIYRPAEMDHGGAYSLQVDTYMLGLMYLELRFGRVPFYYLWSAGHLTVEQINERIPAELDDPRCPYNLGVPTAVLNRSRPSASLGGEERAFVKHCLTADPAHRPTAATLLELYPQLSGEDDAKDWC